MNRDAKAPGLARALDSRLDEYDRDHAHPANRALHLVGIPLIAASIPIAFTSIPIAVGAFATGWTMQLVGHAIEGKRPSFTRDTRFMAVGAIWFVTTILGARRSRRDGSRVDS